MRRCIIHKRVGETPLQAIFRFRQAKPEFSDIPMTYAGRLDPMAEGTLLILIGDECKKRSFYDGLDKEYEFEIALGMESDTGDVLGLVDSIHEVARPREEILRATLRSFVGSHEWPYPVFSSKTVQGKPLFQYAHEGTLDTITIPMAHVSVHRLSFVSMSVVPVGQYIDGVSAKIQSFSLAGDDSRVGSDFRKGAILNQWQSLRPSPVKEITIIRCKAVVSSGTYIRTLAPYIAKKLGTVGLAHAIKRTGIGRYVPITRKVGFWVWKDSKQCLL